MRPLADVLFGVDNTFLSRALDNDIFLPYQSPLLGDVSDALELDSQYRVSPVDFGDICLNYDVAWFEEEDVPPPDSLGDLVDRPMLVSRSSKMRLLPHRAWGSCW